MVYAYSGHSPSLWRGALLLPSGCGKTRCLLDFVTQTGYGERRHSLLLFLVWEEFFLDSHRYPAATRHLDLPA